MREVVVVPPESVKRAGRVRKVQFSASGAELAAWVNPKSPGPEGQGFQLEGLYRYNLSTGARARLQPPFIDYWWYRGECCGDSAVSPDLRWVGTTFRDGPADPWSTVEFEVPTDTGTQSRRDSFNGSVEVMFVHGEPAVCTAITAARNENRELVPRVVRFNLARLSNALPKTTLPTHPPRKPQWDFKWKRLLTGNWDRPVCAALSANGRFLAVADEPGNVHVADLKRKRVVAVHQKARLTADRVIGRVAIDDTGERVFRMANGVLHGPNWQFKPPTGKPTDFALSPDQRTVCAVFDNGHARTFDAATGAVRKELRWGKKPLYSVCFAPDGLTCAAGGLGGRVVVWDVDA